MHCVKPNEYARSTVSVELVALVMMRLFTDSLNFVSGLNRICVFFSSPAAFFLLNAWNYPVCTKENVRKACHSNVVICDCDCDWAGIAFSRRKDTPQQSRIACIGIDLFTTTSSGLFWPSIDFLAHVNSQHTLHGCEHAMHKFYKEKTTILQYLNSARKLQKWKKNSSILVLRITLFSNTINSLNITTNVAALR